MGHTTSSLRHAVRSVRDWVSASSDRSLRPLVEEIVVEYLPRGPLLSSDELEAPAEALSDGSKRLQAVEVQLDAIADSLSPPTGPFHLEMTMAEVLRRHAAARDVLAAIGLPGCDGCSVRHDETLEEAIEAYAFDGPDLLRRLNALLI